MGPEINNNSARESTEFELSLNATQDELAKLKSDTLPAEYEGMSDEQISLALLINNPSTTDAVRNEAIGIYTETMVSGTRGSLVAAAAEIDTPEGVSVPETYLTA